MFEKFVASPTVESVEKMTACWNAWFPQEFRMDKRLLRQLTFEHRSWHTNHSSVIVEKGEICAFLIARRWQNQTVIDALGVSPERRRTKLASLLLEDAHKAGPVRFGGGPAHFFPGLPMGEGWTGARAFLHYHGFEPDYEAEDLFLSLGTRAADFRSCRPEDRDAVVAMVGEEFSRRWAEDTAARFHAGDHEDILIIEQDGAAVAFCQSFHSGSRLLGPSVFWHRHQYANYGGIGPVGVRESCRGKGLGKRIVEEALNYLASKGVVETVVDWTSIGSFYEKIGFKSWRRYQGHRKP